MSKNAAYKMWSLLAIRCAEEPAIAAIPSSMNSSVAGFGSVSVLDFADTGK